MQKLKQDDFFKVVPIFSDVKNSKPLVFSVIDRNVEGSIYVDNIENPRIALVILEDMLFLGRQKSNPQFLSEMYDFLFNEIFPSMQQEYFDFYCMSSELRVEVEPIFNSKIHGRPVRKTFKFIGDMFLQHLDWSEKISENYKMEFIDEAFIKKHNYDKEFWKPSTKRFGFALVDGNEIISECIAVFVGGGQAEISVNTNEKYRNRGFATVTCSAFIEYCLSVDLIPNWGCWDL